MFINLMLFNMEKFFFRKLVLIFSKMLLFLLMVFLFQNAFSQISEEIPLKNESEWFPFYEDENVILFSNKMECVDPAGGPSSIYVFISIENKKEDAVLVQWHYDIYGKTECYTCNDPDNEYDFRFTLNPGESINPDCMHKRIKIDDGANTVFFATYLGKADKPLDPDVIKIVLSNLMSNISD